MCLCQKQQREREAGKQHSAWCTTLKRGIQKEGKWWQQVVGVNRSHFSYLIDKKKGELKTKSRGSIRSSVYPSKYRRHHLAPGKSMEEAVRGLELAAWHGAAAFSKSSFKSRILSVVWGFPDS